MLIRIVRMTFDPAKLDAFLEIFDASAPLIRAVPGCHHLELWQDAQYPNILTTHSHWESTEALDAYRHSELFKTTWAQTRPLFAAAPVAFSHKGLRENIESAS